MHEYCNSLKLARVVETKIVFHARNWVGSFSQSSKLTKQHVARWASCKPSHFCLVGPISDIVVDLQSRRVSIWAAHHIPSPRTRVMSVAGSLREGQGRRKRCDGHPRARHKQVVRLAAQQCFVSKDDAQTRQAGSGADLHGSEEECHGTGSEVGHALHLSLGSHHRAPCLSDGQGCHPQV